MATEHEPEQEQPGLDEVLEAEAEALAAELEQAEQEGMEPGVLEEIEGTVETAAEALITVRDARHKLQESGRHSRVIGPGTSNAARRGPDWRDRSPLEKGRRAVRRLPLSDECGWLRQRGASHAGE